MSPTKKKVMFAGCSILAWVDMAEQLQREAGWVPCYWVGRETIEKNVRLRFPSAVFQNHSDAIWARPASDHGWELPVLDEPLLTALAVTESLFLRMVDRIDYAEVHSYTARRGLYYKHVRFWSGVLDNYQPKVVFFPATPHQLYDFVLYSLCQLRGIRTIMFGLAFDLNRVFCKDDITQGSGVIAPSYAAMLQSHSGMMGTSFDSDVETRLTRITKSYDEGMPQFMVQQQTEDQKQPGRLTFRNVARTTWNAVRGSLGIITAALSSDPARWQTAETIHRSISENLYRDVIGPLRLTSLRRYYESLTSIEDISENFIYLPLAYQPEQSSSPEGGMFVEQALIVDMLSKMIPPGWKIFIKEHPSQFRYFMGTNKASRSHAFYDELLNRPNVRFLPLASNPFALIDGARAVATVTGTSGWEALVRGKPVLHFGYPWWQGCEGAHYTPDIESCRLALAKVSEKVEVDREKVRLFALATQQQSCPGDVYWDSQVQSGCAADNPRVAESVRQMVSLIMRYEAEFGGDIHP
tara:strand:- start:3135 stop:4706 length:1572 start_codon:yes stop_codon:yes gene_type:complete